VLIDGLSVERVHVLDREPPQRQLLMLDRLFARFTSLEPTSATQSLTCLISSICRLFQAGPLLPIGNISSSE
jgi:hypothetical protein